MRNRWTAPLLIAAMWAFALAAYPRLPARVPIHWNLRGEVDGWGGRGAAFLFPAIALGIAGMMAVLPRIDPRKANWEKFADETRVIVSMLVLFMAWIEAVTLGAGLGWNVDVGRATLVGVGALFAVMGNYLPRIRSNWFLGIRTPWTLASDRVWRETHRLAGRTFVAGGAAMVIAGFVSSPAATEVALAAVGIAALVPVVYSYLAWRREAAGRAG